MGEERKARGKPKSPLRMSRAEQEQEEWLREMGKKQEKDTEGGYGGGTPSSGNGEGASQSSTGHKAHIPDAWERGTANPLQVAGGAGAQGSATQPPGGKSSLRKTMAEQAQDEWHEKMRQRPGGQEGTAQFRGGSTGGTAGDSSTSLGHTEEAGEGYAAPDGTAYQAYGHEGSSQDGTSNGGPLTIKDKRALTNGMEKIVGMELAAMKGAARFAYRYGQSDVGRGAQQAEENVSPVAEEAINALRAAMSASMAAGLANDRAFNEALKRTMDKNPGIRRELPATWGKDDLKGLQQDMRKLFKEKGLGKLSSDPVVMRTQLLRAKMKGRITTQEMEDMLLITKKATAVNGVGRIGHQKLLRSIRQKIRRYASQDSTSGAIFMAAELLRYTKVIARNALKVGGTIARAAQFATAKAVLAAAKAKNAAARTKLGEILSKKTPEAVKNAGKSAKKAKEKAGAINQKRKDLKKKRSAVREKLHNMRPSVRFRKKVLAPLKNKLLGGRYNPLRWLGNLFSFTQTIKRIIVAAICAILLSVVVAIMLLIIIDAVVSSYDFASNEEDIRDACFAQITESYKSQLETMENYGNSGGYSKVIYAFSDQDDDTSNDHKTNESYSGTLGYEETTNAAEMLSMAQVYFDFDLDSADEDDVKEYLRQLYNGSHVIETEEVENADGSADLKVTLVTYYFDELFECALSDSASAYGDESPIAGETFDIPLAFPQTTTYEFTAETAYSRYKNSRYKAMKQIITTWYEQGKNYGSNSDDDGMEGIAYITISGVRYYIAMVLERFAVAGDFFDTVMEDGSVIHYIAFDCKGSDASFTYQGQRYGHAYGSSCGVVEYIVRDSGKNPHSYANRLKGSNGSSAARVKQIINGGSWLKNPNGPAFKSATSVDEANENGQAFLSKLSDYSAYIKKNADKVSRGNGPSTYEAFKRSVSAGKETKVNGARIASWALQDLGYLSGGSQVYGTSGGFKGLTGKNKRTLLKAMQQITSGGAVGKTVKEAAGSSLLQPGDILNLSQGGTNTTAVYAGTSGGKAYVYNIQDTNTDTSGCGPFECNYVNTIKGILRWK